MTLSVAIFVSSIVELSADIRAKRAALPCTSISYEIVCAMRATSFTLMVSSPLRPHSITSSPTVDARQVGEIDLRKIHRDRRDHRRATPADQHLASVLKAAPITIRIAYGQNADGRFALRNESVTIADAGARRHAFHLHQSRLEGHDRCEVDLLAHRRHRRQTINRQARAYQVEMRNRAAAPALPSSSAWTTSGRMPALPSVASASSEDAQLRIR